MTKRFRILVTGSRDYDRKDIVHAAIKHYAKLDPIICHGDARGADYLADVVAKELGLDRVKFPANWEGRGKKAGPLRNRLMLEMCQPDLVLAFPLPQSIGTFDMMKLAVNAGIKVLESPDFT